MSVEFTGKRVCIAPEGVFIIGTYDESGVPNAMKVSRIVCIRYRCQGQ